jgi:hypothetical protein
MMQKELQILDGGHAQQRRAEVHQIRQHEVGEEGRVVRKHVVKHAHPLVFGQQLGEQRMQHRPHAQLKGVGVVGG